MLMTPSCFMSLVQVVGLVAALLAAGCAGGAPKPQESVAEQRAAASTPSDRPPHVEQSKSVEESVDHFVAGGWVVFGKARADLDEDGRQDVVALVEHGRSGKSVDGHPMPRSRYVLVVVQDEPFPRLVAMNPEILRMQNQFGMYAPSVHLDAAHGEFSITQSGGSSASRWQYTLNFEHDRARSAWFLASCSFETDSYDVRGRPQTSTGEHSYPYTLKNDFGHLDRGEFEGFCPKL